MRRRDIPMAILAAAIVSPILTGCSESRRGETANYPRTPEEIAAGVVPVDDRLPPGAWRRYGADPTGRADSTGAIQVACSVSTFAFDDAGGTYRVAGVIDVGSNLTVAGIANRTELIVTAADSSVFVAQNANRVLIEGIRFRVLMPSALAYTAPVVFADSSECVCRDCEFSGCSWAGVWLPNALNCTVTGCYFHDFLGSVQDSADICVYNNASNNIITDNRCFGGNDHGILIENPYNNAFPSNNLVARNHIAGQKAYGVCLYVPDEGNTYNQILDNNIENISGIGFKGVSGPGIYVAGTGAGGTLIAENTITHCCIETRVRTESPGGIGLHGMSATNAPLTIANNVINAMASYDGIVVIRSAAKISITGNTVQFPAGNIEGTPIRVESSSYVSVTANTLNRPPSEGRCIFVFANGFPSTDLTVSSNICSGGNYNQIDFTSGAGGYLERIVCSNNSCSDGGAAESAVCLGFAATTGAIVSGNYGSSTDAVAFYLDDAKDFQIRENTFNSEGSTSVIAKGSCDGSVYASSNLQNRAIVNLAVGLLVE